MLFKTLETFNLKATTENDHCEKQFWSNVTPENDKCEKRFWSNVIPENDQCEKHYSRK